MAWLDSPALREGRHLPVRPVVALFAKVCEAVEAAHAVRIVHRDLKPSNILVTPEGEPRLVDFGLSRWEGSTRASLVTLPHQFIGTPQWSSPEQVNAIQGTVDFRSDVYSLGVVLYQLVTGDMPYAVNGPLPQIFDNVLHGTPKRPGSVVTYVERDLEAVILKALAKEPERRYQSVAEFRDDLERYLRGDPVKAKGDSLVYVLWKAVRRHRFAAAGLALFLIVSAAYAVSMTWLYGRARDAEESAAISAMDARVKFQQARGMADFVLKRINEEARSRPSLSDFRRSILEQVYPIYEGLAREHTEDPSLLAYQADALIELSNLDRELDRPADAERHRREALDIRERLLDDDPDNPELLEAISINYVLIGDMLCGRGEVEQGRELYENALKIHEDLVSKYPDNAQYAGDLVFSYERLSYLAKQTSDDTAFRDLALKRHTLAELLAADHPDDLKLQYDLSISHSYLADNLYPPHSTDRCPDDRSAADIALRLLDADPTNALWMRRVAETLAAVMMQPECREMAPDLAANPNRAAELAEALHTAEPDNVDWQHLLAGIYLAQTGVKDTGWVVAPPMQRAIQALDLYLRLARSAPDDPARVRELLGPINAGLSLLQDDGTPHDPLACDLLTLIEEARTLIPPGVRFESYVYGEQADWLANLRPRYSYCGQE